MDDYAHHPTEIKMTLRAARTGEWRRVITPCSSRTSTRGRSFLHDEFATALLEADVAVVADLYGAREEPVPGVSGKLVVDSMLHSEPRSPVVYLPRMSTVVDYLEEPTTGDLGRHAGRRRHPQGG